MLVERGGNDVERVQSRLLNLVVPSNHRKPCGVFNSILGEDHSQRMAQSVSGLNVRINESSWTWHRYHAHLFQFKLSQSVRVFLWAAQGSLIVLISLFPCDCKDNIFIYTHTYLLLCRDAGISTSLFCANGVSDGFKLHVHHALPMSASTLAALSLSF